MAMVKTEHLSYIYSQGTPFEKAAVNDVNLEIEEGEFVGIIGHTGSGKSTLIQHFNGLLQPTSGRIFIDGEDIWANKQNIRQVRFKVGLVFQYPEYQLFEETVAKDIAFGPTNMGLGPEEIENRVTEAMEFVGLNPDLKEKSPFDLSGGQKRRVAIAGVIAMRPKVLILDEPTAGLDPKGRDKILGQIKEYHQQTKSTVLLVSHSMEDIAKYAKKALVMNRARLFAYDTVETIFTKSEEITKMGLSVPQITRVFHELHKQGYPVEDNVYTVKYAANEILTYLRSKGE
ncbi:MAG: energy-coupling factor transporter ATPase [Massiliimalia sp.]|jgi:energy-coupling factor transport system ATP-binding protein